MRKDVEVPALNVGLAIQACQSANPLANSDCKTFKDRFDLMEQLGQGSSAVVYRAKPREGGDEVALKVIRTDDDGMLLIAREEFDMLRSIRHPHIIRAHEFFTYSLGAVMVMELFQGKSLEDTVGSANGGCLPEASCRQLFGALISAVAHLHDRAVVHRDVKASNVLVSPDLTDLRLVDFNTAQSILDGGALTLTGTADYLPPEVIRGNSHTYGSDVWSSGLCLYLMVSGTKPLQLCAFGSHEAFAKAVVKRAEAPLAGGAWDEVSEECKEMVRKCLATDLTKRASAEELLKCEWLA